MKRNKNRPQRLQNEKFKRQPIRSCIGCKEPKPKSELLRIFRTSEGKVEVDETGKKSGRGTYLCKKDSCIAEALQDSKIAKALKIRPDDIIKEDLSKQVKKYL